MNHPYSPTTQGPPPLPAVHQQLTSTPRKTKLVLSTSRAEPFRIASTVIAVFTVVAAVLTFKTGWGINLPLLAAAALGVGFWRKPEMLMDTLTRVQLAVWLALAIAVVFHFDPWTIVPFVLVSMILLGSLLFGRTVDPMRGLARMIVQTILFPWSYWKALRFGRASFGQKDGAINKIVRLTAFPIFIAIGFGTLYVWSNQKLSQWSFNFFDQMLAGDWFIDTLEFGWSLFLSSVIGAGLVYGMKQQDSRLLKVIGKTPSKLAESVSEWSSVSIALVLVNILALVLNTVDGTTTWVGEISTSAAELTRGVHAGTYTLISAIVLAATYLLYHFRVPPKDYERARVLAMAWLGQNLMMAFTVALRNYHYTDAYGLTVKRVGVWLFLSCTATGLYFLGKQVRENGSIEKLVRRQAWAVYLVLATAAIPNWPGLITRYNYQEARMVLDEDYLQKLLPHNINVWAEYAPEILIRHTSPDGMVFYRNFVGPQDFRAWDYQSACRAALKNALPILEPKAAEGTLDIPNSELLIEEGIDAIEYDREAIPEPEPINPHQ